VRKWSEPVPLADVVRAAASEIEHYSRALVSIQPDIMVSGQAVADVVHLLAEIMENATTFSPGDTSVHIAGHRLTSGSVLLEIKDSGVGIPSSRLAEINRRLDNPPVVDVAVSQHMGLFAVSRLAARHGVRVRLQPATPRGLSALVWLPSGLTGSEAAPHAGDRRPSGHSGQRGAFRHAADNGRRGATGRTSGWFRPNRPSGRNMQGGVPNVAGLGATTGVPGLFAQSPPDGIGSRAFNMARTPAQSDRTPAGLPLRVPGEYLIPSAEQMMPRQATLPQRSPESARNRLSGFQRGSREGERPNAGEGATP
jgi:hypothetical protein